MSCKKIFSLLILTISLFSAVAQRISYIVSFPNLQHHEAQIELVVSDIPNRTTVFRMSRSSPGRYATHEFGKNIYDVHAYDQNGKAIPINRADGDVFQQPERAEILGILGEVAQHETTSSLFDVARLVRSGTG